MKKKLLFLSVLLLPSPAFAQGVDLSKGTASNFKDVILYAKVLVDIASMILASLALLTFFWGLSKFILNSNSPLEIKKGQKYMAWGIIALFILISFQAIITLVSTDLEFGGNGELVPQLKINGQQPETSARLVPNN